MNSFTDEQLTKLKSYLEENATLLAKNNCIRQIPYYPNDDNMRRYQWTLIDVPELGLVEMYFTGISSVLIINKIHVEAERVRYFKFYLTESIILTALKEKKIDNSNEFFNKI